MYESDISGEIFVKPYIEDLVSSISSTLINEADTFDKDIYVDNFKLNMDTLVPCSLILNEILTNIFRYGFKSNPNPSLRIHVSKKENEISMIIADNGQGIVEKDKRKTSLGIKLIQALAVQTNAKLQIDFSLNKGICYTLKFNI